LKSPGICILLLLIISLPGCAPQLYKPNPTILPLLNDKKDFTAEAGVSITSLYIETAYAPVNHLVLCGNFAGNIQSLSGNFGKNVFGSAGAGYFCQLPDIGHFEVIGCYGLGINAFQKDIYSGSIVATNHDRYIVNNNFRYLSLQADLGFPNTYTKNEYGLSLKVSALEMNNPVYRIQNVGNTNGTVYSDSSLKIKNLATLLEPCFFILYGKDRLRFSLRLGVYMKLGPADGWLNYLQDNVFMALGVRYQLMNQIPDENVY
jgi:hypothetical protein